MAIYGITSQASNQHEFTIHPYSSELYIATQYLEDLALSELKKELGIPENDYIKSPLRDSINVENISAGVLTLRYRPDSNQRIIEMIRIDKRYNFGLFPEKVRTVIKEFKIVKMEPISDLSEREEDEDDME
jgi:hypothetical protein